MMYYMQTSGTGSVDVNLADFVVSKCCCKEVCCSRQMLMFRFRRWNSGETSRWGFQHGRKLLGMNSAPRVLLPMHVLDKHRQTALAFRVIHTFCHAAVFCFTTGACCHPLQQQDSPQEEHPSAEPPSNIAMTQQAARRKQRFVNLYSQEGRAKDVILLPGRHPCECQASRHALVNNCLRCGRIVCRQEGSGPCFTCDSLVRDACLPAKPLLVTLVFCAKGDLSPSTRLIRIRWRVDNAVPRINLGVE